MKDYIVHQLLIKNYVDSIQALKEHGILTNKKDFTSQIGEWLVCQLYDGIMANGPNQKNWDLIIDGKKVQVKTHAKATTNANRKTYLNYEAGCDIDELILVIFTETYNLKELYRAPWEAVCQAKEFNKAKSEIYWSSLSNYMVDLSSIKNVSVLRLFA